MGVKRTRCLLPDIRCSLHKIGTVKVISMVSLTMNLIFDRVFQSVKDEMFDSLVADTFNRIEGQQGRSSTMECGPCRIYATRYLSGRKLRSWQLQPTRLLCASRGLALWS